MSSSNSTDTTMTATTVVETAQRLVGERESLAQTLQENCSTIKTLREDLIQVHDNNDTVTDVDLFVDGTEQVVATFETNELIGGVTDLMNQSSYSSAVEGSSGNYHVTIEVDDTGGDKEQL